MAQLAYGSITITDTNDIESIIVQYARNQSTSTAPTSGWSTNRPAWAQGYYIWQRTRIHKSGTSEEDDTYGTAVCITGSTGQTGSTGAAGRSLTGTTTQYTTAADSVTITESNMGSYTWTSNVPIYSSSTPAYWVRVTNTYSNPSSTEYIIYKDSGLTSANATANEAWNKADSAQTDASNALSQANAATQATALLGGHFIYNSEWTTTNTPHSANVVQTILKNGIDVTQDPTQWDYNVHIGANGIRLRNNEVVLSEWTNNALKFYAPNVSNQGNLAMQLDGTSLKFYNAGGSVVQAEFGGTQATVSGTINVYDGKIGNASNYWYIGNYTDYNQNDSAIIKSIGTASIQLNETNTWRIATNRIHTAWAPATGTDAYKLHFPIYVDSENTNRHWDYGLHLPTSYSDKFLYIRNAASSETLDNLLDDLDDAGYDYWNYIFYIDGSGNLHAGDIYSHGTLISGTSAPYLLKSGGTMTGNITMSNGAKLIGDVTGNVSGSAGKLSNTSKIGDTNKPVYFSANGVPVAISYEINKSVPSNAIFTDQNVRSTQANTTKLWLVGTPTSGDCTGELNYDSNIYADTTAGALHATTFEGNLSGTASRATADSDGNTIKTTYLKLTGGNVTGAVTFGSSVSVDELTAGDLVVNGNASFTNNAQFNTINGVAVGSNPKFTDTTYSSLSAASSGTAVSLVTTGEKYTWNNKQDKLTNPVTGTGTSGRLTKWTGTNTIGDGPALGSDTTKFLNNKGEWAVPAGTYTYTLPLAANGTRGGVQIGFSTNANNRNYAVQLDNEKMYVNVPWENTTYSAGSGLTLSGTQFKHSNSVTAGTVGTSSATSGATLAVPYVTYDAQGHITGTGTHTHTINGLSGDVLTGGYINIHPENSPTIIPFIHNDIAHLLKRGGSVSAIYDGNTVNYDFTNAFDGSGSYVSVSSSTYSTLIITVNLHTQFTWTNTIYIDFGAAAWRAKSIKIEVINSNYANDVWTQKYNTTTNSLGHAYVTFGHTPVGASNAGGGYNKIRFTLSDFNSTDRRIAQIGVYFYGSLGVRETYMSRGSDDPIFRNITPYANNTYTLGNSSNKWSNVYATTLTGTLDGPVKDVGNGTNTTFAYSKAGLDSTSWFAAWNGYELRAISPAKTKSTLSLSKSDVGLGNVLNFKQVTAIGQGANGTLRVWTGDPSSTSTNDYTDVAVTITAYEQSSVQKAEALNLSAAVGSTNKPVYFKADGKPYAISYTIDKSVPSDAKFTDTTYTAGSGLTLDGTQFKHSNSITAGTVSDGGSTRTLAFGGTFKIPSVTYDAQGHISSTTTITLTMPAAPSSTTNATNDSDGNPINTTYLKKSGGIMSGGLEIKGHIAGDGGSSGHGLWGGGGYHNAYNNIILHGDATTGSSGIAFVSDKGDTTINQPSDRAFIQFHAYGITTTTAESTNPTLATTGEANRLVIGVGNDATDEVWIQTPAAYGLKHQVGTTTYTIPCVSSYTTTANYPVISTTTGGVHAYNTSITMNGGIITATTFSGSLSGNASSATEFSSNATVTLTGDTTGTSAGSKKSWTVSTTTNKLNLVGRFSNSTYINVNVSNTYGYNKLFYSLYDSTSRSTDATNSPSFDAGVLNMTWDWGAYNGQIALTNTNTTPRMQIRAASNTDNGENADPRYTPNYGAWREVVTATKATQIGNGTKLTYVSDNGQITESSSNVGSTRQAVYLNSGTITAGNYTVAHLGNAGKSNMNDVGRLHASVGMTNLTDPGNTTDNPMNGTTKSTSWHLYWDANYTDDPNGSNAWVAQIVNKAGTARWWVRSRSGGTITNGTAWAAEWKHLVVAPQSGQGSATVPIYIDANGHTQSITSYSGNAATATTATTATYSYYPKFVASNEIRFDINSKPSSATDLYFGHAWSDGSKDAKINNYRFENGNSALAGIIAANFNGYTIQSNVPSNAVFTDTKNTAGSTNTDSALFLIGATSQAASPQTYSHDTVKINTTGQIISTGYEMTTSSSMSNAKCQMRYEDSLQAIVFSFA